MIAMAIIGITAVVLLEQRIEVVRDAARARDLRTAWVLSSQKMAELELDKALWTGAQTQSNGDFGDVDPAFTDYRWDYQIVREPIEISDATDKKDAKKPPEILRLTLVVRAPGVDDPIVLEAEFPIRENKPEPAPSTPAEGGAPASGTTPPSGTAPPAAGAPKR
jgi:hypothetical protein